MKARMLSALGWIRSRLDCQRSRAHRPPRRPGRRPSIFDHLERREVLSSATFAPFATIPGQVTTAGAPAPVTLHFSAGQITSSRSSPVLVGFYVEPAPGSSATPEIPEVDGPLGSLTRVTLPERGGIAPSNSLFLTYLDSSATGQDITVDVQEPGKQVGGFVLEAFLPGDANGDGSVDQADLALVKAAYGTALGQPKNDPAADFNADGHVGCIDLRLTEINQGAHVAYTPPSTAVASSVPAAPKAVTPTPIAAPTPTVTPAVATPPPVVVTPAVAAPPVVAATPVVAAPPVVAATPVVVTPVVATTSSATSASTPIPTPVATTTSATTTSSATTSSSVAASSSAAAGSAAAAAAGSTSAGSAAAGSKSAGSAASTASVASTTATTATTTASGAPTAPIQVAPANIQAAPVLMYVYPQAGTPITAGSSAAGTPATAAPAYYYGQPVVQYPGYVPASSATPVYYYGQPVVQSPGTAQASAAMAASQPVIPTSGAGTSASASPITVYYSNGQVAGQLTRA